MTQYCQDGHVCDSLNVQRTTQWPPTRAGEMGHLGPFSHLYGPSVNILSDVKAPSHTDSQIPLSTERRAHHSSQGPVFSLPRLDQFTIHSASQPETSLSPPINLACSLSVIAFLVVVIKCLTRSNFKRMHSSTFMKT